MHNIRRKMGALQTLFPVTGGAWRITTFESDKERPLLAYLVKLVWILQLMNLDKNIVAPNRARHQTHWAARRHNVYGLGSVTVN